MSTSSKEEGSTMYSEIANYAQAIIFFPFYFVGIAIAGGRVSRTPPSFTYVLTASWRYATQIDEKVYPPKRQNK